MCLKQVVEVIRHVKKYCVNTLIQRNYVLMQLNSTKTDVLLLRSWNPRHEILGEGKMLSSQHLLSGLSQ